MAKRQDVNIVLITPNKNLIKLINLRTPNSETPTKQIMTFTNIRIERQSKHLL